MVTPNFIVTYRCTAACDHCLFRSSPERTGVIQLSDVQRNLKDLLGNYPAQRVHFTGGEPLLYFDLVVRLIEEAKAQGVSARTITTNGFWGENPETALKYTTRLKDAGLSRIHISVDVFHQAFVPFDSVRGALRAAQEVDLLAWLNAHGLGDPDSDNPFNRRTKQLAQALAEEFDLQLTGFLGVHMIGRAVDTLTSHLPMTRVPVGGCPREELFRKLPHVMLDPEGWVLVGCGVCIGNTNRMPVSEMLAEYDYTRHPILSVVLEDGAEGLLRIGAEAGYERLPGYANLCHLCYDVRRCLRPHYPDALAPAHLYER